jgi:hypothetical protein
MQPTNSARAKDVAKELGGAHAHRAGKGWLTRCPAHDDKNPSLSVSDGEDGRLLVKCHAGCDATAVLEALRTCGIEAGPATKARRRRGGNIASLEREGFKIVRVYSYRDEAGELLYENVRLERKNGHHEKEFRQRRPNGRGGYIENLNGVRRVPYRLPELLATVEQALHITEGEKDADTLAILGHASTSIATPDAVDLSSFEGKLVYVHEDNDPAGRQKSAKIVAALRCIAAEIRVVRYPDAGDGGDVSDWLTQQGRGPEELLQRLEESSLVGADEGQISTLSCETRCLADVQAEPIQWLWDQRFALGKLGLIAGQPGLGKSQLTLAMVATVTTGGLWPDGAQAPSGSAILVSCEDDAGDTVRPRLEAAAANLRRVHMVDWVVGCAAPGAPPAKHHFDVAAHIAALRDLVIRIGDVRLIVIDPITAYLGTADSHKTADVRTALVPLQMLAAERGVAIVMVSHLNKNSGEAAAMNRVVGSGAFVAVARSAWLVGADPNDGERRRRILTPLKNNIGDDRTGFAFTVESHSLLEGIATSRVVFDPTPVYADAADLLRCPASGPAPDSALEAACEFLRELLADGARPTREVENAARARSISLRTLDNARREVGVCSTRMEGRWWLRLSAASE